MIDFLSKKCYDLGDRTNKETRNHVKSTNKKSTFKCIWRIT